MNNMKTRYLSDFKGFSNNLGFIRIIAAILVILDHSYKVTGSGCDPLDILTGETMSFGGFAVIIFFFASGYLVTGSILKNNSGKKYFVGRFSRLYPAFFTVIVLTALVMGPIVSTLNIGEYFKSSETYSYLTYLIMLPKYALPGVFTNNPDAGTVNGPLWTMVLETICYISLFILWKLKLLTTKMMKVLFPVFIVVVILIFGIKPDFIYSYHLYLRPFCVFLMGCALWIFRDKIPMKWSYTIISVVCLAICFIINCCDLGMILFFPYLLACVVFSSVQVPKVLGDAGRYSYFLYLVGFPVQQTIQNYNLQMTQMANFIFSTLIAACLAVAGYHFIEKPGGKWVETHLFKK